MINTKHKSLYGASQRIKIETLQPRCAIYQPSEEEAQVLSNRWDVLVDVTWDMLSVEHYAHDYADAYAPVCLDLQVVIAK